MRVWPPEIEGAELSIEYSGTVEVVGWIDGAVTRAVLLLRLQVEHPGAVEAVGILCGR